MVQNRNKLIDLFIGNIANAIVHEILEKAIEKEEIADKYRKELELSWRIAKKYRERINPTNTRLPEKDYQYMKTKVTNKVRAELIVRISRGYGNINVGLVEEVVDKALKNIKVI